MRPDEIQDRLIQQDEVSRIEHRHNGALFMRVGFPNGWGASIIWDGYGASAGLMELAVTEGYDGKLNYETPITDDVLGYLDDEKLAKVLDAIRALPPRSKK